MVQDGDYKEVGDKDSCAVGTGRRGASMRRAFLWVTLGIVGLSCAVLWAEEQPVGPVGEEAKGTRSYSDYERPQSCRQCHTEIYAQWANSMMAQSYTHHWDEIEYFQLAVKHGELNPKFKPVSDGCNGCHAPVSFLAGDVPPPKPEKNSRANEGVSCDVCHTISGYDDARLFNFQWFSQPGRTKFGGRGGENSPAHNLVLKPGLQVAKFCATCHNEKSPWGVYVKGTYNEWLEGPYSKENVQCHACHMPAGPGKRALTDGKRYADMRHHLFQGAHVEAKTRGAIDVVLHADTDEAEPGEPVVFTVHLFNQKAGHKIPTGSVEDRLLYVHVEAIDSQGKRYPLAVDKKGFEGEVWTIGDSKAVAYQDFSEVMGLGEQFAGLPRDGVADGDRIFRMPYFTEKGQMTICQWNTARFGVDYRIGPRENKIETYTWVLPDTLPAGPLTVQATLNYQLLVKPVADFLKVPEEESRDRLINVGTTVINVLP